MHTYNTALFVSYPRGEDLLFRCQQGQAIIVVTHHSMFPSTICTHTSDGVYRGSILLSGVSFVQHYCATVRHHRIKIIHRQRVSIWLRQRKRNHWSNLYRWWKNPRSTIVKHIYYLSTVNRLFDCLNMPGMNIAFKNYPDNIVKLITITLPNVIESQNKSIKGWFISHKFRI